MVEIDIEIVNNNNNYSKAEIEQNVRERYRIRNMVRLPNLINRTLFRTKGLSEQETNSTVKRDFTCEEKEALNIDGKDSLNKSSTDQQNMFEIEENFTSQNVQGKARTADVKSERDKLCSSTAIKMSSPEVATKFVCDVKDVKTLTGKSVGELQEYIRNMERSFLFEHNHLIEKCELEKFELRESYEEEKTRLKRAFENEKIELLKEIERKDKMLHKLAEVLKEQYQKDFETSREEFQQNLKEKTDIFLELSHTYESIIIDTGKIVDNNKTMFANLKEFNNIKDCQKRMSYLLENLEESSVKTLNESILAIEKDLVLTGFVSDSERKIKTQEQQNSLRETKCPSFDYDEQSHDEIQHEMTAVYRKQKTELVKLFNAEKEEDQKRSEKEKNRFERDVRTEYESRMSVERKAWQDTIEDLEREIKILKYEREQLDRNYCLGMDEVRTEFEKEKQEIYKRYSEAQSIYESKLRKMMEAKM